MQKSNASDIRNFLKDTVSRIVDDPSSVKINEIREQDGTLFEIRVADSDIGKVIGRNGAVAGALRTIVKVIAMKNKFFSQIDVYSPKRQKNNGREFYGMDNTR